MLKKKLVGILILLSILLSQSVWADSFFKLMTSDFSDGSSFPATFTCDSENTSPEVYFVNLPKKAKSLVLILQDPDTPKGIFFHWVVFNIPITAKEFPGGISKYPPGTMVAKNDFGNSRYDGPCPPKGQTHAYIFTLFALDTVLNLDNNATGADVVAALKNHILAKHVITTEYSR